MCICRQIVSSCYLLSSLSFSGAPDKPVFNSFSIYTYPFYLLDKEKSLGTMRSSISIAAFFCSLSLTTRSLAGTVEDQIEQDSADIERAQRARRWICNPCKPNWAQWSVSVCTVDPSCRPAAGTCQVTCGINVGGVCDYSYACTPNNNYNNNNLLIPLVALSRRNDGPGQIVFLLSFLLSTLISLT